MNTVKKTVYCWRLCCQLFTVILQDNFLQCFVTNYSEEAI